MNEEIRYLLETAEQNRRSVLVDEHDHTNTHSDGHSSMPQVDEKNINVRVQTVLRAVKRELNPTAETTTPQEATGNAASLRTLFEAGQFNELRGRIIDDWRTMEAKEIRHEKERYIETLKRKGKWRGNFNGPTADNA